MASFVLSKDFLLRTEIADFLFLQEMKVRKQEKTKNIKYRKYLVIELKLSTPNYYLYRHLSKTNIIINE